MQRTFHLLCQGKTAPLNSFYYNYSCRQDAEGKGERIRGLKHWLFYRKLFFIANTHFHPLFLFFVMIRYPNQPSCIIRSLCGVNRFVSISLDPHFKLLLTTTRVQEWSCKLGQKSLKAAVSYLKKSFVKGDLFETPLTTQFLAECSAQCFCSVD